MARPKTTQTTYNYLQPPQVVLCREQGAYRPPGGHSHTLPIWVCAAQRGRDFEAPGLERGIHFRGDF